MNKKIAAFIVTVALTVAALLSKAQVSIGFGGGATANYLKTNISNRTYTTINSKLGYCIYLPFQYSFNNWISLYTDLSFMQKNYSIVRIDSFAGINQSFKNTYIQLPLIARWEHGRNRIKGFLDVGIYGAYWLKGRIKGNVPNIFNISDSVHASGQVTEYFALDSYNEKYQFSSQRDNRIEFGWVAGIGAKYALGNRHSLFIECRYYYALTDQQKNYAIHLTPKYNQTFSTLIGLMIELKTARKQ